MTTTPLPPLPAHFASSSEHLQNDVRNYATQARADLEVEVARLREALKEITYDYADRFDMESPSTNLNIKNIFKQARAALESKP